MVYSNILPILHLFHMQKFELTLAVVVIIVVVFYFYYFVHWFWIVRLFDKLIVSYLQLRNDCGRCYSSSNYWFGIFMECTHFSMKMEIVYLRWNESNQYHNMFEIDNELGQRLINFRPSKNIFEKQTYFSSWFMQS